MIVHQNYVSQNNDRHNETYTLAVITTELKANWPKIVLFHHSLISKLVTVTKRSELTSLTLEGDFSDQFDCYAATNTEVEALSLLTPDIMELIQNWDKKASLEISDGKIAVGIETNKFTPEAD